VLIRLSCCTERNSDLGEFEDIGSDGSSARTTVVDVEVVEGNVAVIPCPGMPLSRPPAVAEFLRNDVKLTRSGRSDLYKRYVVFRLRRWLRLWFDCHSTPVRLQVRRRYATIQRRPMSYGVIEIRSILRLLFTRLFIELTSDLSWQLSN